MSKKGKNCDAAQSAAGQISGLVLEMLKIRDEEGVTSEEFHTLFTESGDIHLRKMIAGLKVDRAAKHIIDCNVNPFVPDKVKVKKHRKGGMFEWTPDNIRLCFASEQKNSDTDSPDLRKELTNQYVLNANVLDYLLANQHLIPEEWANKYVFFLGTIYQYRHGGLCVRYLRWYINSWTSNTYPLNHKWDDEDPVIMRVN